MKYPRLLLLLTTYICTYYFFSASSVYNELLSFLLRLKYVGIFLGGFFYVYSFTAAPAAAVLFVLSKEYNIFFAGLIAGGGAFLSDIIIYSFVKYTFAEEISVLKKEAPIVFICNLRKKLFGHFDKFVMPIVASIFIATPLPTEFGVSLMTSFKTVSIRHFILFAYMLHTVGIVIIMYIGKLIV